MDAVLRSDALLSVEEAAKRLGGISKWTVHAWLSQGKLERTKVGGRTMIRESELAKVIQDGGKSPAPSRSRNDQWRIECPCSFERRNNAALRGHVFSDRHICKDLQRKTNGTTSRKD